MDRRVRIRKCGTGKFGIFAVNDSGKQVDDMKKQAGVILALAVAVLLSACGLAEGAQNGGKDENAEKTAYAGEEPEKREFFGMDTYITFTAYGAGAGEALEEAENRIKELEGLWSVTDENSEIYRINHGNGHPVTVSRETAEAVVYALEMAKETEGSLEPTIYPVLTAWGFTAGENRVPEKEEIAGLLANVGYEKVAVHKDQIQVPEGMELDLGAVGKGYAGDIITALLEERGITSALLDIGGNIQAVGSRPDGSGWRLGIRSPFGEGTLGALTVSDRAVVTSGSYERYFVDEYGKEYGHIIDPATGYPADNELAAITIVAKEGKQGDALSTAMFVKGLKDAESYWQENQDFDMLAVTKGGDIYLTEGICASFSLSPDFANMEIHIMSAGTGDAVTEGTGEYRGFLMDNVLHSQEEGEIHFHAYIPDSYDGTKPYALFFTLPGYQGLYFQGMGMNLETEDFGFTAQEYNPEMIVVAPQLEDWGETSARQTIALVEYFLSAYNIDREKVYAEGYSGGGETMSLVMGMRPELFTAYLHNSSRWDGNLEVLTQSRTPVYLAIGEKDEYYGAEPSQEAYDQIYERYSREGLTEEEIDRLLVLDIKDSAYFESKGISSQHEGGAALFPHDEEIMGWLFTQ